MPYFTIIKDLKWVLYRIFLPIHLDLAKYAENFFLKRSYAAWVIS